MQKNLKDYPKRGDVYIADLNPGFGREIHKKRPSLIISNNTINRNSFSVIILPFSSVVPQNLSPDIVTDSSKGLNKPSVILTDQIRSVDKDRLVRKIGKLSKGTLEEVEEALKLVLGMIELD